MIPLRLILRRVSHGNEAVQTFTDTGLTLSMPRGRWAQLEFPDDVVVEVRRKRIPPKP